jgi:hypothetical protein
VRVIRGTETDGADSVRGSCCGLSGNAFSNTGNTPFFVDGVDNQVAATKGKTFFRFHFPVREREMNRLRFFSVFTVALVAATDTDTEKHIFHNRCSLL